MHQASSPSRDAEPVLGLEPLAEQVALGVDDAARLAGGAGGEDDQRRVLGGHLLDRGRRLLRPVLVEDRGDVGHRHRRDPVGQLAEQRLLADAELRVGGADPQLEVLAAQLRVAGQRHRPHPPAGEHRQHPLDPVADQRHHDVAAPDPAGRKGAREPGRAGEQLAEVPVPPIPSASIATIPSREAGDRSIRSSTSRPEASTTS